MKSAIADYHYIIYCLRIEPIYGDPIYLTNYPRDLTINGNVYKTDSGYDFTGIESSTNFSASVFDLTGIVDIAGISRDKLASGVFDNAKVYAFATTWNDPQEDEEPIGKAIFGKTQLIDDRYRVELMGLIDCLNQSVGDTYQALCQKTLGGQEFAGCKVDLSGYTVTGTITSVTDQYSFADSSRSEADDYFGMGTITFTSGDNAGLKSKEIKSFSSGAITLFEATEYLPQVGDTYEMIAGCRKRFTEDCVGKFDNAINSGAFPHVPTSTVYVRGGVNT